MRILLFLICFLIISCDLPSEANKDCSGVQGGLAEIDDCGICSGGLTAYSANSDKGCDDECFSGAEFDECGVCGGDNSSCSDCLNVPNGSAVLDECGVCNGLGGCVCPDQNNSCSCCCEEDEVLDCLGVCAGPAVLDDCGICNGGILFGTNPGDVCGCTVSDVIDACGECGGEGYINCMELYIENNNDFICNTNGNPPYDIGEQLSCETLETEFDICYPEDFGSVRFSDFEDKIIFVIYEEDW